MKPSYRQSVEKKERIKRLLKQSPFYLSIFVILIFIIDFGFNQTTFFERAFQIIYISAILAFVGMVITRYIFFPPKRQRVRVWVIDFFLLIFLLLIVFETPYLEIFQHPAFMYFAFFLIFIRELTTAGIGQSRKQLNPALLFIVSFILLIVAGTILLLLPNATHAGISFVNAFFTATSAVCVTGLIVVDTGTYFTVTGQTIILILIQLGGLGIMTFTSFFSYFFKGSASFEDQLMLKDLTSSDKVTEVLSTLKTILGVTFIIEGIGAFIIYMSIADNALDDSVDGIFFSVFHAVSAFCNAGFSTLANGLYEAEFRFNYSMQLTIAFLFIIGGLGFPIVYNLLKYLKYKIRVKILSGSMTYRPWVLNINSKIIFVTTGILIAAGFFFFFVFEYNNTLAEHGLWGKIVTAFFGGVTPRTAGFNSVDMTALNFSTIMVIFLLMWIGASPGSTGGGIKTTTIAIGTLNYFSLARGKDRIEAFGREISNISVRRAFAAISLSLVVIGFSVFLMATFDKEKDLLDIAFEAFSAYSTVGLSLGITADLTMPSKFVIIFTMFIGRVGMLTILVAFFRKVSTFSYRYPTENILIN